MYARVRKFLGDPFNLAMAMLILAYFGTPAFIRDYFGPLRKVALTWGAVLLLVRTLKNPRYLKNRYVLVLCCFCIANCITIALNWRSKLFSNIFTFGYVVVTILLIFTMFYDLDAEETERKMIIFAKINILFTFVFAVAALFMFVFSVVGYYERNGSYQYYGVYENRLWGLFNPNTGGMTALVSIIFSLALLRKYRKSIFLITNILIQYIYLLLTQSRSAFLSFMICMIIYIIFICLGRENFSFKDKKRCGVYVGRALLLVLILCLSVPAVKKTVVFIPYVVNNIAGGMNNDEKEAAVKLELTRIENFNEDNINSVSNGRIDIWNAAFQVFKSSPVFGVGSSNVYERGKELLPEVRALAMKGGGTHNVYISVLTNTGVVGFGCFAVFLLLLCWNQIKYLFGSKKLNVEHIILSGMVFAIMAGDMMESRLIYSKSFLCFVFWISCGYLVYDKGKKTDEKV